MNSSPRLVLFGLCLFLSLGCFRVKPAESEAPLRSFEYEPPPSTLVDAKPTGKPFQVRFETTKGNFVVQAHPEWAPRGTAQFRELVESGFFDETRFFRVVPGFMVQFGINGDPQVQAKWRDRTIQDDRVLKTNSPGMMTFATSGPDSRTTQVFINYGNNAFLDSQGFAPFARVIEGMDVVNAINSDYGESPDQGSIQSRGNVYLDEKFPRLDYVKKAILIELPDPETEATSDTSSESPESTPEPDSPAEPASQPAGETPPAAEKTPAPAANSAIPPETIEEIK